MMKDKIVYFDTRITTLVQRGPKWLQAPMSAITNSGQPAVMLLLAVGTCIVAWQHSQLNIVYGLIAAVASIGANALLRHFIHRTRPDTLYVSRMYFKTSSFPSGHAFSSAIILTILAYLAAAYLLMPWAILAPIFLAFFAVAVSISRVYLGAHFPTDVLAGSALGAVGAWIIIGVFAL
jgi:undecaprenyl-diphosphatase